MTLLHFPITTAASGDRRPERRDGATTDGEVLVIASRDQALLPNLGGTGLRATFAECIGTLDAGIDADLVLVCAGENGAADIRNGLRHARAVGAPVIAWGTFTTEERVTMLEAGVQDVIATDCPPQELRARMQLHLRARAARAGRGWRLVTASRSLVSPDGAVIHLSPALNQILRMLLEANGEVVRREDLARAFYKTLANRALDAQMCRLRAKLHAHGCPMLLRGVKGLGYSLTPQGEPVIVE